MNASFRISGLTAIALLVSGALIAAPLSHTERFVRDFPMEAGAALWVENPIGNVDVVGSDQHGVSISVVKVVGAPDSDSLKEGREQTQILMEGDANSRVIRTVVTGTRESRWKSNVAYVIRVPRASQVHVKGNMGEHIKVSSIAGAVTVKNVNGDIFLDSVGGAVTVDSANGDIHFLTDSKPAQPVMLTTINGGIEVQVNSESNLDWIAQSIKGDFRTNMPVRGRISGNAFRGMINSAGGPSMTTTALMGNIFLLSKGGSQDDIRSVRMAAPRNMTPVRISPVQVGQNIAAYSETIQTPLVQGNFIYATNYGNFHIGEVRGFVSLQTGAGQVTLGTVTGDCTVRSGGGPLDLGVIFGTLNARTEAGEVLVRSASRKGGEVSTGAGTLRVMYAAGPLTLHNGGGDIIVNQAAGSVDADTRSGDLSLTMDPRLHTQRVTAKTTKGNILFNVGPRFGAEIDATVLTTQEDAVGIHSDFTGLTVKRDQFNGKTRIRATGRIGGGGEKIELYAEDGEIQIDQQGVAH